MGDFKNFVFGFTLICLVVIATITAVISVGNTYHQNTDDFVIFKASQMNETLNLISSNATSINDAIFSNTEKRSIFLDIYLWLGVFGNLKTMVIAMITAPFYLIINVLTNVLHLPGYVAGVITSLLILGVILAVIKLLKAGE